MNRALMYMAAMILCAFLLASVWGSHYELEQSW